MHNDEGGGGGGGGAGVGQAGVIVHVNSFGHLGPSISDYFAASRPYSAWRLAWFPPFGLLVLSRDPAHDHEDMQAAVLGLLDHTRNDALCSRFIDQLLPFTHTARTLPEAVRALAQPCARHAPSTKVRLQVYPRALAGDVLREWEGLQASAPGVPSLSPTDFHTLATVVQSPLSGFHVGAVPRQSHFKGNTNEQHGKQRAAAAEGGGDNASKPSSRAFHKLHEALVRFAHVAPLDCGLVQQLGRLQHAPAKHEGQERAPALKCLDIGASPGGWTQFLATHPSLDCSVVAVDPAALDGSVSALPNVVHLRAKVEDCIGDLERLGPFELVVCDMNVHWRDTVKWLMSLQLSKIFRSGQGLLVLTLKCVLQASSLKVQQIVDEVAELMRPGFDFVQCVHLMSNSKRERTVLARYRP